MALATTTLSKQPVVVVSTVRIVRGDEVLHRVNTTANLWAEWDPENAEPVALLETALGDASTAQYRAFRELFGLPID